MKVFSITFYLFFITNLISAQNNSFNGTFFNTQIGLSISLTGNNGNYTGQYNLQDQAFPITAQTQSEHTLVGSYPYFGNIVPIQLMLIEGSYILITEGVTVPLTFAAVQPDENQLASNRNEIIPVKSPTQGEEIAINIPPSSTQTSHLKAAGRAFADPYAGFRFNIPNDWTGQEVENGSYLIGHTKKAGFILVMPHQYASVNEMYQESAQGIHEEGIQLTPTSGVQKYGRKGLIANYNGAIQGQMVKAHAIGLLSPHGGGLTMLIAVRNDLYTNDYLTTLQSIANSVTFSKPKTSPVAGQWKNRINGKRLLYMKTANGMSKKITIDLCSSGNFGYNSNSSGMSGGPTVLTYAGQDGGQGTWKIISRRNAAILVLNYNTGEFAEYQLANGASNGQIQLDGRRYFVQEESGCY